MAYTTTTPAGAGFADRIRSIFSALRRAAAHRSAYNRTYNELSRLTNRELADIGLHRCDIKNTCRDSMR